MSVSIRTKIMEVLFNVQGYYAKDIHFSNDNKKIIIEVEQTFESRCPRCGLSGNSYHYDTSYRMIYIGSILCRPVYARVKIYRFDCPNCGVLTERQSISTGKSRYSKSIGKMIIQYTKLLDNVSTGKLLGISESTIYRSDREELSKLMECYLEKVPQVHKACVDEVAYKRRHNYATILTNQKDGKVLWIEKDRKSESLSSAYNKLSGNLSNLKSVSMDFWTAYDKATTAKFPWVSIVYDRFHLSQILNRHVEEERRNYQKNLPPDKRKYVKKNTRWLLLRRRSNFNETHIERFNQLKKDNERLYEMYLLKEDFLSIFDYKISRQEAHIKIMKWVSLVTMLPYPSLMSFAKKVIKRIQKILNWFDDPISNGKAEGINNTIKTLLKRAYGYKDFDYFRMKVLQKCGYLMEAPTHTF